MYVGYYFDSWISAIAPNLLWVFSLLNSQIYIIFCFALWQLLKRYQLENRPKPLGEIENIVINPMI